MKTIGPLEKSWAPVFVICAIGYKAQLPAQYQYKKIPEFKYSLIRIFVCNEFNQAGNSLLDMYFSQGISNKICLTFIIYQTKLKKKNPFGAGNNLWH